MSALLARFMVFSISERERALPSDATASALVGPLFDVREMERMAVYYIINGEHIVDFNGLLLRALTRVEEAFSSESTASKTALRILGFNGL